MAGLLVLSLHPGGFGDAERQGRALLDVRSAKDLLIWAMPGSW